MNKSTQSRNINRAEVVDQNFLDHLTAIEEGRVAVFDRPGVPNSDLLELFDSQMVSRQLDLMARIKRLENKVFYTIGSSGHEGNALVGRLTRATDPAFLHYRSGGFMAERYRKREGLDFIRDTCLSFAAAREDVASGGRHKVWGHPDLWVLPQTSTIASHLPKAVGTALAIAHGSGGQHELPVPSDSIVVCSFGDAGLNHAAAQTAINSCAWSRHQSLPVPVLLVCEDNDIGISVPTPTNWVADSMRNRHGISYHYANGLDLVEGHDAVRRAVEECRTRRRPVFLHLKTTRLMGHAGTDFEIEYRPGAELESAEARDPLKISAEALVGRGLMTPAQIRERYRALAERCLAEADRADGAGRITTRDEVMKPLAPFSPDAVAEEAARMPKQEERTRVFGNERLLPEHQPVKHLAVQINRALTDLMVKYPEALAFGEDVARKGGVYTVTKGLAWRFGPRRVFNTLLDETTILGLAQGCGAMGYLPIPEIQYLAYFHNACDQIRGEACSLQYFSNNRFRNPMVMRIASLGYQKGFGGHFHNDNSIAALRDIPGLIVGCPSRGDDAVTMLRTMMALGKVDGRVSAFLEPIALYMSKDLHEKDDGQWSFRYPAPGKHLVPFSPRIYNESADDLLIVTFGNGVPMALRCARELEIERGIAVRVLDLRWLKPLDSEAVARHAGECRSVVVFDEGRPDGGIGEAVMTALVEAGVADRPVRRLTGADCYIPLGDAANLILATEAELLGKCLDVLGKAE
ncbi:MULTISPECIES: transketolase C-terminal domain-containing protein [unclassified Wenzhouxiangella]|uniref:transketolase C-terminal domain-containing protein n=1 Tax=unclassified Wenzhouxiangella TaxID=2613841 RepID=UPI000E326449|nr:MULTISPECIES: transketolase C-terminal domain-containing protein [unclassified Wenzhouxiangella]RFF26360.1 MFS transporter [Wenzhouxiangella sp. 15181]RFP67368.1 MFS transporter [Wenzhouxiangella sp. 15190]